MSGIYMIKNMVDSKVYIGQSVDIRSRLWHHKSMLKNNRHPNSYLQRAFNKYGVDNFLFEAREYCDTDKLDEREIYYINLYDSMNRDKGYNRESGGSLHKKMSKESRMKMSLAKRGMYDGKKNPMYGVHRAHTEEEKKRLSERFSGEGNPMYGVHLKLSEERKQQISERTKGEKNPFYGKKHTEETKQKMRDGKKKKPVICIETQEKYVSAIEAHEMTGVNLDCIYKSCKHGDVKAGGYHWKYDVA